MKKKWYAVPPYSGADWKIVDINGEHVADFEDQEECEHVVALHNESLTAAQQHKS